MTRHMDTQITIVAYVSKIKFKPAHIHMLALVLYTEFRDSLCLLLLGQSILGFVSWKLKFIHPNKLGMNEIR